MAYTGSVSTQLGKQWVKQGNDVYQLNPDGSLGSKLSYDEFISTYQKQGLNLDNIPQYQAPTTSSPTQTTTQSTSTATAPTSVSGPTGNIQLSESGQYGITANGDVYDTKTGQHIDQTTFQQLGLNAALLPKLSQPPTNTADAFDPSAFGIDANLWSQLDPATQAFVQSMTGLAKSTYDTGASNFSINAQTLNQALSAAQNDPAIKAKYGDAAIMAQKDLTNNLGYLNAEFAQNFGLMTAQQAQQRKDLADQYAGMGQAQSGFRKQAEQLQQQQQNGIIQSSQRQLEQQVRSLGSQYEQQYGTAALPAISAGGATYQPYGGIQGSVPFQQQADILNKQQQIYSAEANPLVK